MICLWARDYPKPMPDDLYYIGAALHMAEGGDFSNPLIVRQEYPSHYYFVYPPTHSYALASWLKFTGISDRAVRGFYMAWYFIAAVSTIALLRKQGALRLWECLVPLGVCTALHATGLRTEALSVGATMAGYALVECLGFNLLANFFGMLLLLLGASAAPRLAFFSGSLLVLSVGKLWLKAGSSKSRLLAVLPVLFAGAFILGLFLWQIDFRWSEFWHTFAVNARIFTTRTRLDRLLNFLNDNPYLNDSQSPLLWALAALLFFAWPKFKSDSALTGFAILFGFLAEAIARGLGAGALWYVVLALLLFSSHTAKHLPALAPRLTVALVFLFLLANAEIIANEVQRFRGKITNNRGDLFQAALNLRVTKEHPVLIDAWTARYVYNYRIPDGFGDIQNAVRFPKNHIIMQWHPDDIYVIGPDNVQVLTDFSFLVQEVKIRSIFAMANRHIFCEPCRVYVIPAEECRPRIERP